MCTSSKVALPCFAGSPGYLGGMELGSAFAELQGVAPSPVFAMMATLSAPLLQVPFDAATVVGDKELQWICRDTSKPGETGPKFVCKCSPMILQW